MNVIQLDGQDSVIDWFGYWPTFHDSEIVGISLQRASESRVDVLTWLTRNQVDSEGIYIREKYAVVSFVLSSITDLSLGGFSGQNVISGLSIEAHSSGIRLVLHPSFGISGYVEADQIRVEVRPLQNAPHTTTR
jgi:hypothetical protein